MKYKAAKKILKRDTSNLSIIDKSLNISIEKEIEECLERQQEEIDQAVEELLEVARQKFNSLSEFKIFIVNNMTLNATG